MNADVAQEQLYPRSVRRRGYFEYSNESETLLQTEARVTSTERDRGSALRQPLADYLKYHGTTPTLKRWRRRPQSRCGRVLRSHD